jgi:hypothetical protein
MKGVRWADDKLGLGLVLAPAGFAAFHALDIATCFDANNLMLPLSTLLMLLVTYVLAGMDASQRGKSASLLVLMFWVVGYPLHMRERARYSNTFFGLGSALAVMAGWLCLVTLAAVLHGQVAIGSPIDAIR